MIETSMKNFSQLLNSKFLKSKFNRLRIFVSLVLSSVIISELLSQKIVNLTIESYFPKIILMLIILMAVFGIWTKSFTEKMKNQDEVKKLRMRLSAGFIIVLFINLSNMYQKAFLFSHLKDEILTTRGSVISLSVMWIRSSEELTVKE